jgi:hypothetical protein
LKTTSPKAGARTLHLASESSACAASHYLRCSSACRPDNRNFAPALCPCQNWCCACRPDNRQIRKNGRISLGAKMLWHVGRIIGATRKNSGFHELPRGCSMSAGQSAQPEKMPDLLVAYHVAACRPENWYDVANRHSPRPGRHSLLCWRGGHCSKIAGWSRCPAPRPADRRKGNPRTLSSRSASPIGRCESGRRLPGPRPTAANPVGMSGGRESALNSKFVY